jgi:hypothetical protein
MDPTMMPEEKVPAVEDWRPLGISGKAFQEFLCGRG